MAVEGVRKFFERFMPTRTTNLVKMQEPELLDTGKACKPCTVCKATMKAKEECLKEKGAEELCKDEIENHNECLRKNGLTVVATSPV